MTKSEITGPTREYTNSPTRDDKGVAPEQLATLVRECIAMMRSGGIARLELKYGELELLLQAQKPAKAGQRLAGSDPASSESLLESPLPNDAGHIITAPMIGTFYHASVPGEPVFVSPGDRVEEGQTIGIIEAMKIMNEIAADRAGIVDTILAINGQTVEYGSPLIRLLPVAS